VALIFLGGFGAFFWKIKKTDIPSRGVRGVEPQRNLNKQVWTGVEIVALGAKILADCSLIIYKKGDYAPNKSKQNAENRQIIHNFAR